MAQFVSVRGRKNDSLGDTDLGKGSNTNSKLQKLLAKVSAADTSDKNDNADLDAINSVVGQAHEEDVPRELLVPAPEEWNCFPEASEDAKIKIAASIYQYGLFHRITLWKQKNGKYMILGGHTRTAAFDYIYDATLDEKYKKLPALVYDYDQLTDIDAHRIFIVSNTDQRNMSVKTLSEAYNDLMKLEKTKAFYGSGLYARDAAARQANISPSLFNRYIHLLKLSDKLINAVDTKEISVKTGYELSFLPKELQDYISNKELHIGMTYQVASSLRGAKATKDIDAKLKMIADAPKYYKYQVITKLHKPTGYEIVPVIVDKDNREEVLQYIRKCLKDAKFDFQVIV